MTKYRRLGPPSMLVHTLLGLGLRARNRDASFLTADSFCDGSPELLQMARRTWWSR